MKAQIKQILFISLAIVIGAQISFNLYNSDFKISIGILVFSISLLFLGKYPVIPTTILSAIGVSAVRAIMLWLQTGSFHFLRFVPEMIFYLVYGTLFYFYIKRNNYELSVRSSIFLFLFDFLSNNIELLLRYPSYQYTSHTYVSLILVAMLRTAVIAFIIFCLRYYKFSLLKREHIERYQRLLLLNSKLNDEVVLMQKNKKMIETTMNTAYNLFQDMEKAGLDSSLSRKALNVAKDVHEIKKEYTMILRGLSEALELDMREEGMYLNDILQLLKNSLKSSLPAGKELFLDFQISESLYTEKHYFIMSVFRNLFVNAIEASKTNVIHIVVHQNITEDYYQFVIEDDGPGIASDYMEHIFSPGFSTKINYETGEINRGLGLNLVKDLIENQFGGLVRVTSRPGQTIFTITIPINKWKGES